MTKKLRPSRASLVVITPVYNESDVLASYAAAVRKHLLDRPDVDGKVVLIDDGSSDNSWELIEGLAKSDARFRGIRLSRNFGAHTAVSAGIQNPGVDPDAAVMIPCDLQDPPDVAAKFIDKWREGADIVWGVRRTRQESFLRRFTSRMFVNALRRFAMPKGSKFTTGGFFLIDRKVLNAVREMREQSRINFALVAWTGFDQTQVLYDRRERIAGQSGWSIGQMLHAMYDAFVGFSTLPIRVMTISAASAALLAFGLAVYVLFDVTSSHPLPGWASAIFVPSLFFAVQFSLMAIMGEYLYRIYREAIHRPPYFISADTNPSAVDDDK